MQIFESLAFFPRRHPTFFCYWRFLISTDLSQHNIDQATFNDVTSNWH
jgi:hypothetical protein